MKILPLSNSSKEVLVDDDLFEELNRYDWKITKQGYSRATIGGDNNKKAKELWGEFAWLNKIE